jgi:hypothetical protein
MFALAMSSRLAQSLWTHLEIPTKLLIEIEVMGTGPRCFREHFLAFTVSIADGEDRLKKILKFYRGASAGRPAASSGPALQYMPGKMRAVLAR